MLLFYLLLFLVISDISDNSSTVSLSPSASTGGWQRLAGVGLDWLLFAATLLLQQHLRTEEGSGNNFVGGGGPAGPAGK